MDASKLTAYRESARVAAKLADFYKDFSGLTIGMQMLIGDDIPTLATAVVELVAEVERLQSLCATGKAIIHDIADGSEYRRGREDERLAAWIRLAYGERGEHVAATTEPKPIDQQRCGDKGDA